MHKKMHKYFSLFSVESVTTLYVVVYVCVVGMEGSDWFQQGALQL